MMSRVVFIDTSIVCELLRVPGKNQKAKATKSEFTLRCDAGQRFILPVSTIVETGNHIEQAKGNREAAQDFADLVRAAVEGRGDLQVNRVNWDADFLDQVLAGAGTGVSFVDLASSHQLGSGDIAILVERDQYVAATAFTTADVEIWTNDTRLAAYA